MNQEDVTNAFLHWRV